MAEIIESAAASDGGTLYVKLKHGNDIFDIIAYNRISDGNKDIEINGIRNDKELMNKVKNILKIIENMNNGNEDIIKEILKKINGAQQAAGAVT